MLPQQSKCLKFESIPGDQADKKDLYLHKYTQDTCIIIVQRMVHHNHLLHFYYPHLFYVNLSLRIVAKSTLLCKSNKNLLPIYQKIGITEKKNSGMNVSWWHYSILCLQDIGCLGLGLGGKPVWINDCKYTKKKFVSSQLFTLKIYAKI